VLLLLLTMGVAGVARDGTLSFQIGRILIDQIRRLTLVVGNMVYKLLYLCAMDAYYLVVHYRPAPLYLPRGLVIEQDGRGGGHCEGMGVLYGVLPQWEFIPLNFPLDALILLLPHDLSHVDTHFINNLRGIRILLLLQD
jgi:hypothetical protein